MTSEKSRILSYKVVIDDSGVKTASNNIRRELQKFHKSLVVGLGAVSEAAQKRIVNFKETAEQFNRIQGTVRATSTTVSAAVKELGQESAGASSHIKNLNTQLTSLNTRSGNLSKKINDNTLGMKKYSVGVGSLNVVGKQFTDTSLRMGSAMKITNGMFDESTRIVRSAKNDLLDLVRINAMLIATITAGIGVPTKFFGDFQKELISLKALGEFSTEQLEIFSKQAREVSLDIGQMSKDIASSGIEMVRLGLTAEETNIAHPIGDKRFPPGLRSRLFLKPKTDQEIRTQTHKLPENIHFH